MALPNHQHLLLLPLLTTVFTRILPDFFVKSAPMYPFNCSSHIQTCYSYLYHISKELEIEQIASFYSVNTSQIKPISHGANQDYLVSVPCTCKEVNGTHGYFYDTFYKVQSGDTFVTVTGEFYSGQAWQIESVDKLFVPGDTITISLVCGCLEVDSQVVVTYTVQEHDTLTQIAELLSANVSRIENMNGRLTQDPSFIDVGWVLFVPMEMGMGSIQTPKQGKRHNLTIFIVSAVASAVTLFSISTLILFILRRNKNHGSREKDPKTVTKSSSLKKANLRNQLHQAKYIEGVASLESDRPVTYSLEEIDEATSNFDESRKIGEGGYGIVYIGILKEREVAIKKMKSSRSKEFFAELKVLCKIHHINVVELLGYASGDNHLYLVYEYIQNGSLNEHLHDPLLKGNLPLSWTERAHIALDAARGIEYTHDHTKARYVHRDIKTSNILLDQGLRAKVADFGLARLVERSNEEDFVATRLVGTLGYIAPESVRELQMTSKIDVFAFGVVLAELITGQRALIRDNCEPNKIKPLVSVKSVLEIVLKRKGPATVVVVENNMDTRLIAIYYFPEMSDRGFFCYCNAAYLKLCYRYKPYYCLMYKIFQDENTETALEANIDGNLRGSYPMEEVYKMAEISRRCLSEDAIIRPEMREVVQTLSQILISSIEWEASLGRKSEVFTGLLNGR